MVVYSTNDDGVAVAIWAPVSGVLAFDGGTTWATLRSICLIVAPQSLVSPVATRKWRRFVVKIRVAPGASVPVCLMLLMMERKKEVPLQPLAIALWAWRGDGWARRVTLMCLISENELFVLTMNRVHEPCPRTVLVNDPQVSAVLAGGATIDIETKYPFEDVATVTVTSKSAMPVYLRIPG
jgi:hypothetical protein